MNKQNIIVGMEERGECEKGGGGGKGESITQQKKTTWQPVTSQQTAVEKELWLVLPQLPTLGIQTLLYKPIPPL